MGSSPKISPACCSSSLYMHDVSLGGAGLAKIHPLHPKHLTSHLTLHLSLVCFTFCHHIAYAIMPFNCVVYGCSNVSGKCLAIHKFPKDKALCKLWIDFVQRKRKWDPKPEKSHICSTHFKPEDYKNYQIVMSGFQKKLSLKQNAVPSVYPTDQDGSSMSDPPVMRGAARKLCVQRVSFLLMIINILSENILMVIYE